MLVSKKRESSGLSRRRSGKIVRYLARPVSELKAPLREAFVWTVFVFITAAAGNIATAETAHGRDGWAEPQAQALTLAGGKIALPVVRRDMETRVLELLAPLKEGSIVAKDWRLDGVYISAWIYLRFRREGGTNPGTTLAEVALYPTPYVPRPACVAGGLAVVADDVATRATGLASAVCGALEGDDGEALFQRSVRQLKGSLSGVDGSRTPETGIATHAGPAGPGDAGVSAVPRARAPWLARMAVSGVAAQIAFALWLLTLVGLSGLVLTRRKHEGEEAPVCWWEGLSLAGALITGAILRLVLPTVTVLKEAYPFRGFRAITAPFPGMDNPAELGLPIIQHAISGVLLWFSPGLYPDEAFTYLNLSLAILSPLLVFLVLRAWTIGDARGNTTALLAAWLMALLPLHIKYSASEALTIASQAYLAGALLSLGLLSRNRASVPGRRLLASVGLGISAWLLFLVRPENPILAPLFPLGAFALSQGPWRARLTTTLWASVATGIALLPPLLLHLAGGGAGAEPPSLALLHRLLPPHNVFLNLAYTPLLVPVAAALGISVALLRRRRVDLSLALLALGGLTLLYPVYAAIVSDVIPFGESRYQVNLTIFWLLLAASGLAWPLSARWLQERPGLRGLLLHGIVALFAANAALYVDYVRDASYNPQMEIRFFLDELRPRLETGAGLGGCEVWLSPRDDQRYKDEEGDQFVELFASQSARRARSPEHGASDGLVIADLRSLPVIMESGARCALFFRNLFCYRAHEASLQENPQCRRILNSPDVTPIVERVIPNRPYHRERAPLLGTRDTLTFGLYRVPLPLGHPAD